MSGTTLSRRSALNTAQVVLFAGDKPGETVHGIVKFTKDGAIRNILAKVPMSREQGDLYKAGSKQDANGRWVDNERMTAAGYLKCNNYMGVNFRFPDVIRDDDGRTVSNPHYYRHEDRSILAIRARCIGVGRNHLGNYVARDITLMFDLETYFAQDLWSKWQGRGKDSQTAEWGKIFASEQEARTSRAFESMKVYRIPGGLWMAVNLGNREVIGLIGEHVNRQKFAERNVQTICIRNLLKFFLGGRTMANPDGTVPVVSWQQPDRDWQEIGAQFDQAEQGKVTIDGQDVMVSAENETIGDKPEHIEEFAGEFSEDGDDIDGDRARGSYSEPSTPQSFQPQQTQQAQPQAPDTQKLQADCRDLINKLGKDSDDVAAALADNRIGSMAAIATADSSVLQAVKADLTKALDARKPAEGELIGGATKKKDSRRFTQ